MEAREEILGFTQEDNCEMMIANALMMLSIYQRKKGLKAKWNKIIWQRRLSYWKKMKIKASKV